MSSTKTRERQQRIINLVHEGITDVEDLGGRLLVSISTIRRDLNQLASEGRLVRTYGGAAFVNQDRREHTLNERMFIQRPQKEAIAALAFRQIQEGDTLILDAGTTTAALARMLCGRGDLHVITNNIEALTILARDPDIRVTMLGGDVRKLSMGSVGPLADLALERVSADKVFLGADGIVADRGLCEASPDQAYLKEKMMDRAETTFVLADSQKLGFAGQQAWTPMHRSWTLITDTGASAAQLAPFQELENVTVLVAAAADNPA